MAVPLSRVWLSRVTLIVGEPLHWVPRARMVSDDTEVGKLIEPVVVALVGRYKALPAEAVVSLIVLALLGITILSASMVAISGVAAKERKITKPIAAKTRIKMASWGLEKEDV